MSGWTLFGTIFAAAQIAIYVSVAGWVCRYFISTTREERAEDKRRAAEEPDDWPNGHGGWG